MMCISCTAWESAALCGPCRASLRTATPRRLPAGLLVVSGYRHEGAARRLVHQLKYRGLDAAATVLAAGIVDRLPPAGRVLVPVPRARLRRWSHGVDPAARLAVEIGERAGLPVATVLNASWWWPRHAGRRRAGRRATVPGFRRTALLPPGSVLVDDVLTTGATLTSAAVAAGAVVGAVTATAAGI